MPQLPLTDVTGGSGLGFEHVTGAFTVEAGGDSRYLPECMGPGVILFDADGDGDDDLFVANGCAFPGRPERSPAPTCHLFRNQGGLRFDDVTESAGLGITAYGMGGAAADVDGDGDTDLLYTTWGGPRLFRNDGTLRFTEITATCGLRSDGWTDAAGRRGPDWSTSAVFLDADRDGDLDLFVGNYVRWTPESDVYASLDGRRKSFTIPDRYHGNSCRFFVNDGSGSFTDRTRDSGVFNEEGKSLGVALWDLDQDGLLDVVVANDTQPNFLYRNLGEGRFREIGLDAGIAYDENARTRAGMGIDVADYLNDGVPGIPIGNFSNEPVALYRMEGPMFFRDVTQQAGVAAVTQVMLTFGLLFTDLDLDGLQDLVLANGHLEPRIQEVQAEIAYAQRPQALRNLGNGRFRDWAAGLGEAFSQPMVARGLAVSDLDGDGDPDLVFGINGGGVRLFRNDRAAGGHWLKVRLGAKGGNSDAIGAMVTLRAGGRVQRRMVRTGSSYLSQSGRELLFGLGEATAVESLEVRWPDGSQEPIPVQGVDRLLEARQR